MSASTPRTKASCPASTRSARCDSSRSAVVRVAAGLLILAATSTAQVSEPANADPRLIIKAESNLVLVPLHVSKGRNAVAGLGPEDFEVFEDGIRQEIAFVETSGAQGEAISQRRSVPKEIIFLIDVSISVSRWRLLDDQAIRKGILDALTEDFLVSVYGFGITLKQYAAPTRDPAELVRALYQLALSREGQSRVYQSVFHVLHHAAARGGNARRRLFVFSDGLDTTRFKPDRVVQTARTLGISINPVTVAGPEVSHIPTGPKRIDQSISKRRAALSRMDYDAHTGQFQSLGRRTGGRKYEIDLMDWRSLSRVTESVAELARTEYVVGYYPGLIDDEMTTHEVKVLLKDKRTGTLRGGRRLVAH
ncbi:MAG: VWA domain-containing protein [Bryobacterales bacterium]|nr:VWA domain-containing protein [Bryobacterales bacterium]